ATKEPAEITRVLEAERRSDTCGGVVGVEQQATRTRHENIVEEALGGLAGVLSTENAQVAWRHRQLRGIVGDAMAARRVSLDELQEPRHDAMGRTLRLDAMGRGIMARQHDERLVELRTQEIDAVGAVVGELALHRGEPRAYTAGSGRR